MSERKGTRALELWCKRLVKDCPDVQIENMTTSWRNGIAFCALVHHFRPDLIDMSTLKPDNIYENNQLAFSIAEKHLGIPALLDPEDMVANEVPDRLSVLTYLSQFYQRLGHTVNTKTSENESKLSSPSTTAPIKFGKTGLDKCAACGLPVYLAQRLIVSHKLYHRRCFRCSKCSGHLNPKNFDINDGSEFLCDSCKNEKSLSKFYNDNISDQMGMLAFNDDVTDTKPDVRDEDRSYSPKFRSKPQSILEKISMFENKDKDTSIENKNKLMIKDNLNSKLLESNSLNTVCDTSVPISISPSSVEITQSSIEFNKPPEEMTNDNTLYKNTPEKVYKSNINKFNFLQTQLSGENIDKSNESDKIGESISSNNNKESSVSDMTEKRICAESEDEDHIGSSNLQSIEVLKEGSNITDDIRIAKCHSSNEDIIPLESNDLSKNEQDIMISVPPRRKKKTSSPVILQDQDKNTSSENYPVHLNPFSDDEEEDIQEEVTLKKVSTNPFGSSDDEDDDVPPVQLPPKVPTIENVTPMKRLITAYNPFWSDGEEPSSDEDTNEGSMYKSSMATSTPNLQVGTTRRKKAKAPLPPPIISVDTSHLDNPSTSMDDVASISSYSSYNSTVQSDQKSFGKSTPKLKKKRIAPTPPDSLSTISGGACSLDKGLDTSDCRRVKGPAPGLPLPERREVKLQISLEELQVQLDLLETQQLGLERQGVLIERMIRDKCEGDEPTTVPQEEVEDLVIQLCELVNEKNDLFRKQTELMYIRRQQRLEQEQADIEHEIRVIQSRPAVNRIDADKAREEQLVTRLVQIVRLRDEVVQQIDAERRRERQEDYAIAASIATKRAQRNSESNSSSMKSMEVVPTPKKNKVKDKMKKQFKKAKHTLISKKKDDSGDKKGEKAEKITK